MLLGAMRWGLSRCRQTVAVHPHGDFPDDLQQELALRHPFDVHPIALAFPHLCRVYTERHGRLSGPRGALLLLQAAYAQFMTGLVHCCPDLQALLAGRDGANPDIQQAFALYTEVEPLSHGAPPSPSHMRSRQQPFLDTPLPKVL